MIDSVKAPIIAFSATESSPSSVPGWAVGTRRLVSPCAIACADPDHQMAAVAAMQLWGYNNVSTEAELTRDEVDRLELSTPTAIAMYAPTREQVDLFWSSIPPWARPSPPECTTVKIPGIGVQDAYVCLTHLRWVG